MPRKRKFKFDLDSVNNYDFFNDKFEDKDKKKHSKPYEYHNHSFKRYKI